MKIEYFLEDCPGHPLAIAIQVMDSSDSADALIRYQAFCQGVLFLMNCYEEITEDECRALSTDITNRGILQ